MLLLSRDLIRVLSDHHDEEILPNRPTVHGGHEHVTVLRHALRPDLPKAVVQKLKRKREAAVGPGRAAGDEAKKKKRRRTMEKNADGAGGAGAAEEQGGEEDQDDERLYYSGDEDIAEREAAAAARASAEAQRVRDEQQSAFSELLKRLEQELRNFTDKLLLKNLIAVNVKRRLLISCDLRAADLEHALVVITKLYDECLRHEALATAHEDEEAESIDPDSSHQARMGRNNILREVLELERVVFAPQILKLILQIIEVAGNESPTFGCVYPHSLLQNVPPARVAGNPVLEREELRLKGETEEDEAMPHLGVLSEADERARAERQRVFDRAENEFAKEAAGGGGEGGGVVEDPGVVSEKEQLREIALGTVAGLMGKGKKKGKGIKGNLPLLKGMKKGEAKKGKGMKGKGKAAALKGKKKGKGDASPKGGKGAKAGPASPSPSPPPPRQKITFTGLVRERHRVLQEGGAGAGSPDGEQDTAGAGGGKGKKQHNVKVNVVRGNLVEGHHRMEAPQDQEAGEEAADPVPPAPPVAAEQSFDQEGNPIPPDAEEAGAEWDDAAGAEQGEEGVVEQGGQNVLGHIQNFVSGVVDKVHSAVRGDEDVADFDEVDGAGDVGAASGESSLSDEDQSLAEVERQNKLGLAAALLNAADEGDENELNLADPHYISPQQISERPFAKWTPWNYLFSTHCSLQLFSEDDYYARHLEYIFGVRQNLTAKHLAAMSRHWTYIDAYVKRITERRRTVTVNMRTGRLSFEHRNKTMERQEALFFAQWRWRRSRVLDLAYALLPRIIPWTSAAMNVPASPVPGEVAALLTSLGNLAKGHARTHAAAERKRKTGGGQHQGRNFNDAQDLDEAANQNPFLPPLLASAKTLKSYGMTGWRQTVEADVAEKMLNYTLEDAGSAIRDLFGFTLDYESFPKVVVTQVEKYSALSIHPKVDSTGKKVKPPKTEAYKAGVAVGDMLISVCGARVTDLEHWPGDTADDALLRRIRRRGRKEVGFAFLREKYFSRYLQLVADEKTADLGLKTEKCKIKSVAAGGWAKLCGLRKGDYIVVVNDIFAEKARVVARDKIPAPPAATGAQQVEEVKVTEIDVLCERNGPRPLHMLVRRDAGAFDEVSRQRAEDGSRFRTLPGKWTKRIVELNTGLNIAKLAVKTREREQRRYLDIPRAKALGLKLQVVDDADGERGARGGGERSVDQLQKKINRPRSWAGSLTLERNLLGRVNRNALRQWFLDRRASSMDELMVKILATSTTTTPNSSKNSKFAPSGSSSHLEVRTVLKRIADHRDTYEAWKRTQLSSSSASETENQSQSQTEATTSAGGTTSTVVLDDDMMSDGTIDEMALQKHSLFYRLTDAKFYVAHPRATAFDAANSNSVAATRTIERVPLPADRGTTKVLPPVNLGYLDRGPHEQKVANAERQHMKKKMDEMELQYMRSKKQRIKDIVAEEQATDEQTKKVDRYVAKIREFLQQTGLRNSEVEFVAVNLWKTVVLYSEKLRRFDRKLAKKADKEKRETLLRDAFSGGGGGRGSAMGGVERGAFGAQPGEGENPVTAAPPPDLAARPFLFATDAEEGEEAEEDQDDAEEGEDQDDEDEAGSDLDEQDADSNAENESPPSAGENVDDQDGTNRRVRFDDENARDSDGDSPQEDDRGRARSGSKSRGAKAGKNRRKAKLSGPQKRPPRPPLQNFPPHAEEFFRIVQPSVRACTQMLSLHFPADPETQTAAELRLLKKCTDFCVDLDASLEASMESLEADARRDLAAIEEETKANAGVWEYFTHAAAIEAKEKMEAKLKELETQKKVTKLRLLKKRYNLGAELGERTDEELGTMDLEVDDIVVNVALACRAPFFEVATVAEEPKKPTEDGDGKNAQQKSAPRTSASAKEDRTMAARALIFGAGGMARADAVDAVWTPDRCWRSVGYCDALELFSAKSYYVRRRKRRFTPALEAFQEAGQEVSAFSFIPPRSREVVTQCTLFVLFATLQPLLNSALILEETDGLASSGGTDRGGGASAPEAGVGGNKNKPRSKSPKSPSKASSNQRTSGPSVCWNTEALRRSPIAKSVLWECFLLASAIVRTSWGAGRAEDGRGGSNGLKDLLSRWEQHPPGVFLPIVGAGDERGIFGRLADAATNAAQGVVDFLGGVFSAIYGADGADNLDEALDPSDIRGISLAEMRRDPSKFRLSGDGVSGLLPETPQHVRSRNALARFRIWNLLANFFVVPGLDRRCKLLIAEDMLAMLSLDRAVFPRGTRLVVGRGFLNVLLDTLEEPEFFLDEIDWDAPLRGGEKDGSASAPGGGGDETGASVLQKMKDRHRARAAATAKAKARHRAAAENEKRKEVVRQYANTPTADGVFQREISALIGADRDEALATADKLQTALLHLCTWFFRAFPRGAHQKLYHLAFRMLFFSRVEPSFRRKQQCLSLIRILLLAGYVPLTTDSDRSWFSRHATLQHVSLKQNYFSFEAFVPKLLLVWGEVKWLELFADTLAITAVSSEYMLEGVGGGKDVYRIGTTAAKNAQTRADSGLWVYVTAQELFRVVFHGLSTIAMEIAECVRHAKQHAHEEFKFQHDPELAGNQRAAARRDRRARAATAAPSKAKTAPAASGGGTGGSKPNKAAPPNKLNDPNAKASATYPLLLDEEVLRRFLDCLYLSSCVAGAWYRNAKCSEDELEAFCVAISAYVYEVELDFTADDWGKLFAPCVTTKEIGILGVKKGDFLLPTGYENAGFFSRMIGFEKACRRAFSLKMVRVGGGGVTVGGLNAWGGGGGGGGANTKNAPSGGAGGSAGTVVDETDTERRARQDHEKEAAVLERYNRTYREREALARANLDAAKEQAQRRLAGKATETASGLAGVGAFGGVSTTSVDELPLSALHSTDSNPYPVGLLAGGETDVISAFDNISDRPELEAMAPNGSFEDTQLVFGYESSLQLSKAQRVFNVPDECWQIQQAEVAAANEDAERQRRGARLRRKAPKVGFDLQRPAGLRVEGVGSSGVGGGGDGGRGGGGAGPQEVGPQEVGPPPGGPGLEAGERAGPEAEAGPPKLYYSEPPSSWYEEDGPQRERLVLGRTAHAHQRQPLILFAPEDEAVANTDDNQKQGAPAEAAVEAAGEEQQKADGAVGAADDPASGAVGAADQDKDGALPEQDLHAPAEDHDAEEIELAMEFARQNRDLDAEAEELDMAMKQGVKAERRKFVQVLGGDRIATNASAEKQLLEGGIVGVAGGGFATGGRVTTDASAAASADPAASARIAGGTPGSSFLVLSFYHPKHLYTGSPMDDFWPVALKTASEAIRLPSLLAAEEQEAAEEAAEQAKGAAEDSSDSDDSSNTIAEYTEEHESAGFRAAQRYFYRYEHALIWRPLSHHISPVPWEDEYALHKVGLRKFAQLTRAFAEAGHLRGRRSEKLLEIEGGAALAQFADTRSGDMEEEDEAEDVDGSSLGEDGVLRQIEADREADEGFADLLDATARLMIAKDGNKTRRGNNPTNRRRMVRFAPGTGLFSPTTAGPSSPPSIVVVNLMHLCPDMDTSKSRRSNRLAVLRRAFTAAVMVASYRIEADLRRANWCTRNVWRHWIVPNVGDNFFYEDEVAKQAAEEAQAAEKAVDDLHKLGVEKKRKHKKKAGIKSGLRELLAVSPVRGTNKKMNKTTASSSRSAASSQVGFRLESLVTDSTLAAAAPQAVAAALRLVLRNGRSLVLKSINAEDLDRERFSGYFCFRLSRPLHEQGLLESKTDGEVEVEGAGTGGTTTTESKSKAARDRALSDARGGLQTLGVVGAARRAEGEQDFSDMSEDSDDVGDDDKDDTTYESGFAKAKSLQKRPKVKEVALAADEFNMVKTAKQHLPEDEFALDSDDGTPDSLSKVKYPPYQLAHMAHVVVQRAPGTLKRYGMMSFQLEVGHGFRPADVKRLARRFAAAWQARAEKMIAAVSRWMLKNENPPNTTLDSPDDDGDEEAPEVGPDFEFAEDDNAAWEQLKRQLRNAVGLGNLGLDWSRFPRVEVTESSFPAPKSKSEPKPPVAGDVLLLVANHRITKLTSWLPLARSGSAPPLVPGGNNMPPAPVAAALVDRCEFEPEAALLYFLAEAVLTSQESGAKPVNLRRQKVQLPTLVFLQEKFTARFAQVGYSQEVEAGGKYAALGLDAEEGLEFGGKRLKITTAPQKPSWARHVGIKRRDEILVVNDLSCLEPEDPEVRRRVLKYFGAAEPRPRAEPVEAPDSVTAPVESEDEVEAKPLHLLLTRLSEPFPLKVRQREAVIDRSLKFDVTALTKIVDERVLRGTGGPRRTSRGKTAADGGRHVDLEKNPDVEKRGARSPTHAKGESEAAQKAKERRESPSAKPKAGAAFLYAPEDRKAGQEADDGEHQEAAQELSDESVTIDDEDHHDAPTESDEDVEPLAPVPQDNIGAALQPPHNPLAVPPPSGARTPPPPPPPKPPKPPLPWYQQPNWLEAKNCRTLYLLDHLKRLNRDQKVLEQLQALADRWRAWEEAQEQKELVRMMLADLEAKRCNAVWRIEDRNRSSMYAQDVLSHFALNGRQIFIDDLIRKRRKREAQLGVVRPPPPKTWLVDTGGDLGFPPRLAEKLSDAENAADAENAPDDEEDLSELTATDELEDPDMTGMERAFHHVAVAERGRDFFRRQQRKTSSRYYMVEELGLLGPSQYQRYGLVGWRDWKLDEPALKIAVQKLKAMKRNVEARKQKARIARRAKGKGGKPGRRGAAGASDSDGDDEVDTQPRTMKRKGNYKGGGKIKGGKPKPKVSPKAKAKGKGRAKLQRAVRSIKEGSHAAENDTDSDETSSYRTSSSGDDIELHSRDPLFSAFGFALNWAEFPRVVVTQVRENSLAAQHGLSRNDRLLRILDVPVSQIPVKAVDLDSFDLTSVQEAILLRAARMLEVPDSVVLGAAGGEQGGSSPTSGEQRAGEAGGDLPLAAAAALAHDNVRNPLAKGSGFGFVFLTEAFHDSYLQLSASSFAEFSWGLQVDATPSIKVRLARVEKQSWAALHALKRGDSVLAINDKFFYKTSVPDDGSGIYVATRGHDFRLKGNRPGVDQLEQFFVLPGSAGADLLGTPVDGADLDSPDKVRSDESETNVEAEVDEPDTLHQILVERIASGGQKKRLATAIETRVKCDFPANWMRFERRRLGLPLEDSSSEESDAKVLSASVSEEEPVKKKGKGKRRRPKKKPAPRLSFIRRMLRKLGLLYPEPRLEGETSSSSSGSSRGASATSTLASMKILEERSPRTFKKGGSIELLQAPFLFMPEAQQGRPPVVVDEPPVSPKSKNKSRKTTPAKEDHHDHRGPRRRRSPSPGPRTVVIGEEVGPVQQEEDFLMGAFGGGGQEGDGLDQLDVPQPPAVPAAYDFDYNYFVLKDDPRHAAWEFDRVDRLETENMERPDEIKRVFQPLYRPTRGGADDENWELDDELQAMVEEEEEREKATKEVEVVVKTAKGKNSRDAEEVDAVVKTEKGKKEMLTVVKTEKGKHSKEKKGKGRRRAGGDQDEQETIVKTVRGKKARSKSRKSSDEQETVVKTVRGKNARSESRKSSGREGSSGRKKAKPKQVVNVVRGNLTAGHSPSPK